MKYPKNYLAKIYLIIVKTVLSMALLHIAVFIRSVEAADEQHKIPLTIEYSTDNGKSFQEQAVVAQGSKLWLRVSWDYIRQNTGRSPYLTALHSNEQDFASANVGMKRWSGEKAWYQKIPPGYISADKQSIIIKMDLAARQTGTMGFNNRWDKSKRKFVNGPLPVCSALKPGNYNFTFTIYYRTPSRQKISGTKTFQVEVTATAAVEPTQPTVTGSSRQQSSATVNKNMAPTGKLFQVTEGDNSGTIALQLEFSRDGKTFSPQGMIPVGGILWLRASWDNMRPGGGRSPYLFSIYSIQGDFASANVGLQRWGGHKAWYQKTPPGYISAAKSTVIVKVNLGARAAGVKGFKNHWDKQLGKFVNGPLPACPALTDGKHQFTFAIYYRNSSNKKIAGEKTFLLTPANNNASVNSRAASGSNITIIKHYQPAPLPALPPTAILLPAAKIINLANKQPAKVSNGMVRVRNDLLGWVIAPQVPARPYYLSWTVQSGSKHGMELLDRHNPFLYLNGQPIAFDYARGPQRQGKEFITQIQSRNAISLKPGDHLRISKLFNNGLVGDLRLYRQSLKPAPIRVRGFVESLNIMTAELNYKIISQADRQLNAVATLRNMSNQQQQYQIKFIAKNYWQKPVKTAKSVITVQPYKTKQLKFSFPLTNSQRYTSTVTVNGKNDYKFQQTIDVQHSTTNQWRSFKWLDRGWKSYLVDAKWNSPKVPAGINATPLDLPGMFYANKNKTRLFKKEFTLSKIFKNKKIILNFSGAGDEVTLWLNDKIIMAKQNMQRVPFQIDVTDKVKFSNTNTLTMLIAKTSRLALRNITIEAMPKQHIATVQLVPSFRHKNIAINISTQAAKQLTLSGTINYLGNPVLQLPPVTLNHDQTKLKVDWKNPILWDIENPRLLKLQLTLKNSNGKIVDSKMIRFGFREIWVDGSKVKLNGKPQIFRAIAMNGGYDHRMMKNSSIRARIRLRKKLGINFLRHIYQAGAYASIADEEGILLAQGLLTIAHPTVEKLHNDKLWREKDRLSLNIVRNLYNHPAIVEWYISNEFAESLRGDIRKLAIKRLITSQQAVKTLDSSRLFGHGCDLDLNGYNAFYSTHYPIDIHGLRNLKTYTPDVCLWHQPDQPLTKGMKVPNGQIKTVANVHFTSPISWGTKPIFVGEFGWNMFYNPPGGFMQLFGDKVLSSIWEIKRAHHRTNAMFNAGHREAEVALYTTWDHAGNDPYHNVPKIAFYLWNQSHVWYADSKITIPMNIFHETNKDGNYNLTVTLNCSGSKQLILDKKLNLKPMSIYRKTLNFKTPSVTVKTTGKITYLLNVGSKIIAKKTVDIVIYPRTVKPLVSQQAILVYASTPKLMKYLKELSLTVKPIASLEQLSSLPPQPLIIAPNALKSATEPEIKQLESYVGSGGRVLILQQPQVHGLFNLNTTTKISSIVFKRAFNAPAIAKFTDTDLKYWYKEHVVSRYDYRKPRQQPGIALLDSGSGIGGLAYTPLFRLTAGRGVCYLSQLDLTAAYRQSPIAAKIFRSLVATIIKFRPATKKFGTFVKADSRLERFLKKLKLTMNSSQPLSAYQAIICDADLLADNKFKTAVKLYLQHGGTVYFKNVNFTNQATLSTVLGAKLTFAKNDLPAVKGRALILVNDPVLDGISQEDLFWRRWQESENTANSFRTDKDFLAKLSDLQGMVKHGQALLYPNSLIKVKVGTGTAYLDMLRWEQAPLLLKRKTSRIATSLLDNLGAKFKITSSTKLNLTHAKFAFINLKSYFNRSLTDQVDNDGQGSWNDQGPKADMRTVPTGKQTFKRIPFLIATGKNCITLHSKYRQAKLPNKITIPINQQVKGLAFLYTSAWTGAKEHGAFNIHYQDGSNYTISLAGGRTLRDWVDKHPSKAFQNDNDVQTEFAYSCRTGDGRLASLFQLTWSNPKPTVKISKISFTTTDNAVIALLSITAITAPTTKVKLSTDNPKLSATFYQQALGLYKQHKYSAAINSFQKAIQASGKNYPAYLLLADIYQINHNYTAAEQLLLRLIAQAPQQLEAYTKLGAIYEKQGKNQQALEIYRKSFKVERNQPWIMQAITRMKSKLSP